MGTVASARGRQLLFGPAVYGMAVTILRITLVVGGLAAAYLLYGLLSGELGRFKMLPRPDRLRILANISFAQTVLSWSFFVAALMAAYVYFMEDTIGYILVGVGALLYVGVPFLFAYFGDSLTLVRNAATAHALASFPKAAWGFLIWGGLLITYDVAVKLVDGVQSRPLSRDTLQYGTDAAIEKRPLRLALLGKCWEGRFCRDFIRVHCPIFQSRKACWRVKRGCYCEGDIVTNAALKMSGKPLQMAPDARYNFANDPAPTPRKVELTPSEKRERCRQCVIYNDHQRQKYQIVMPLVIVGVIALAILNGVLLREYLRMGLGGIETVMGRFSFGEAAIGGISWKLGKPSQTVEWVMIAAFTTMAIAKALQTLEWAIFKLKV